jgi:DNA processing protein
MNGGGRRERLARVALSRLVEPGHRGLAPFLDRAGAAAVLDEVLLAPDPGPAALPARLRATLSKRLAGADPWLRAAADLAQAQETGARLIVPGDPEWPEPALELLGPLADAEEAPVAAPLCLWARGPARLDELAARAVAVVGARAVSPYGALVASELGYGLAEHGWAVVSGAALGVDAAAHRGALAADGVTAAVLACGVDVAYPLAHTSLLNRIAERGVVISELPPGERPQRRWFLSRNRLVAAFGCGLVVVEAGSRSGTSVTAERAHQLGRVLMAVPGPVTSAQSVGTHRLIRDRGAILVTSAADVIEEVGPIGVLPAEIAAPDDVEAPDPLDRAGLAADLALLLEAVPATRPATPEAIALAARMPPGLVRRGLPALEARGFVELAGPGYRLTAAACRPRG